MGGVLLGELGQLVLHGHSALVNLGDTCACGTLRHEKAALRHCNGNWTNGICMDPNRPEREKC